MSNLLSLKSKYLLGVTIVAIVVAGALFAFAMTASAQQAVVSASDIQYAATVQQGSSGQAVIIWQRFLNGYSSANLVNDGAFGPMTSAAAKIWQASRSLVADGVLGAMSRASAVAQINANVVLPGPGTFPAGCSSASGFSVTTGLSCGSSLPAGCTSAAGYSPTTGVKCDGSTTPPTPPTPSGPLTGGAGSITVTALSTYGDEQVGEDESDVKVAAFEIEADDDSDVDITSMKIELNQQTAADSEDMDDYMESVSIWMGSEMVGEADAGDFSESAGQVWTKSIALDDAIVRAGETEKFYLAVTALSNMDSGDMDSDDWQIGVSNVRFVDGEGV